MKWLKAWEASLQVAASCEVREPGGIIILYSGLAACLGKIHGQAASEMSLADLARALECAEEFTEPRAAACRCLLEALAQIVHDDDNLRFVAGRFPSWAELLLTREDTTPLQEVTIKELEKGAFTTIDNIRLRSTSGATPV